MKQACTRWLPLIAGFLLLGPAGRAQVTPALATPSGSPTRSLLPPVSRPVGKSLPGQAGLPGGAGPAGRLAQRRTLARAGTTPATRASTTSARAGSNITETVTPVHVTRTPRFRRADSAVDAAGNTYVTGNYADVTSLQADYITLKYSPSGQLLWQRTYNGTLGTGASEDRAVALAVDGAGNVYVSGTSFRTPSGGSTDPRRDIATVKYSASGQELWVSRFSAGSNQEEVADLTVDAAGNVYVSGITTSFPNSPSYDLLTVKYAPDGAQLWTTAYGLGRNNQTAKQVVVDAAGDVFVLGTTGSSTNSVVYKYAGASGRQLWISETPASTLNFLSALVVDPAGNVLVTGYTTPTLSAPSDYLTVKYSGASGQVLWQTRYNGPANSSDRAANVALDAAGNVVVTGTSSTSSSGLLREIVTLKYAGNSGQPLWEARSVGDAVAADVVVDATGNAYVSGTSFRSGTPAYTTVKYAAASGQQAWEAHHDNGPNNVGTVARRVGLDTGGHVYVIGEANAPAGGPEVVLLKYEQHSAQPGWEARFPSSGSSAEIAKDVVTDASGNVYVTGYAYNGRNYDYATVKYAATGESLWEARYNGPTDGEDLPTNVVVDAAGNVYVSGTSYSATESDYATLKYSPSGQQVWVARYNGPASGYDVAAKVVVDGAGNVLVTGSSDNGPTGSYDYATLKYDPAGQPVWATRYNGSANSVDLAADLVLDPAGDVYVTGTTYSATQSDYATLKYAGSSGQPLWEKTYDGPAHGYDQATTLALLARLGSVVVTGSSDGGPSTGYDFATLSYSSRDGQPAWLQRYNGPHNGDDIAADLVVARQVDEYVVVTGTSLGGSSADYATLKYFGESGQLFWSTAYDGPENGYDEATAVAVDAGGNPYVTGLSYHRDGTNDYATVKYQLTSNSTLIFPPARLLWTARYDGPGSSYDEAAAVTVDGANNVYVTGFSLGADTGYDFATLQYRQNEGLGPVAVTGAKSRVAARGSLVTAPPSGHSGQSLTVYPNPASGPATVRFRAVQEGPAQVLVYNQLGQQVALLYEGPVHKGQAYEMPWSGQQLPPGLYTCWLRVGSHRETVHLLLQR